MGPPDSASCACPVMAPVEEGGSMAGRHSVEQAAAHLRETYAGSLAHCQDMTVEELEVCELLMHVDMLNPATPVHAVVMCINCWIGCVSRSAKRT